MKIYSFQSFLLGREEGQYKVFHVIMGRVGEYIPTVKPWVLSRMQKWGLIISNTKKMPEGKSKSPDIHGTQLGWCPWQELPTHWSWIWRECHRTQGSQVMSLVRNILDPQSKKELTNCTNWPLNDLIISKWLFSLCSNNNMHSWGFQANLGNTSKAGSMLKDVFLQQLQVKRHLKRENIPMSLWLRNIMSISFWVANKEVTLKMKTTLPRCPHTWSSPYSALSRNVEWASLKELLFRGKQTQPLINPLWVEELQSTDSPWRALVLSLKNGIIVYVISGQFGLFIS